jgi:hypothetical protein
LTIGPAAAPKPALKYKLLPPVEEMAPGNAIQSYYRAFSPEWFTNARKPEVYEKVEKALKTPLKEMPQKELAWVLESAQLREVDLGARRAYCDWDFTERIKKEGWGMLLPDVQSFRQFATLLACRARLEMAGGHYDKAARSFATGMTLGKHAADAPTLINALVGVAICQVMLQQVEEWIQTPGSPNLYWALAELPQPYISLRRGLQAEQVFLEAAIPMLKDLATARLGSEQARVLGEQVVRAQHSLEGGSRAPTVGDQAIATMLAVKLYPEAKRALIAEGRTQADVESMPVIQVVLIHALEQYQQLRDDLVKWASLPYWQAYRGVEQANQQIRKAKENLQGVPFTSVLPALSKVTAATARLDRRIAALRCIEAIRLHAAAHGGQLPATLADITEVPVPIDPTTGQAFHYQLDGGKAVLEGGLLPGFENIPSYTLRYELTLKR